MLRREYLLMTVVALLYGAESKNILLVPCQITSHFLELTSMSSGLAAKGYDVYVTMSRGFDKADKVLKSGVKPLYYEPLPGSLSIEWITSQAFDIDELTLLFNTSRTVMHDCRAMMQDRQLNQDIKRIGFDLAIVDGFLLSYCSFLLPHVHGIPYVFLFATIHPWDAGVPALPSFAPLIQGTSYLSDDMSFFQRLQNFAAYLLLNNFPVPGRYDKSLLHEYAPDVGSWQALVYKSELFIETRNFILEKPSPSMPNVIQTAGITVSPPKPLPAQLEAVMQAAGDKGVVLVSFGSIASNFPDHITDKLIEAFNRLEQTVIWKFSGRSLEDMKARVKKHVHLLSWLPQNDLLGHPDTRVFVTHCGNNGQHEAVYHAVPMVGLPIFAEQFHNAFRLMDRGYGLSLIPGGLTDFSPDQLVAAIGEVATNNTYRENIQKASRIMRDAPMSPVETSTYWLEHVIKFGGSHLRSHGLDMPWYTYFMIDILVFLAVMLHITGYLTFLVARKIIRVVMSPKKKTKVA